MSKDSLVIIILFVVIAGVVGVFALTNQNETLVTESESAVSNNEVSTPTVTNTEMSGQYLLFSPEVVSSSADTRRVLFFYANWCPTCQPADASFSQNLSQLPQDVTVIRVNYNDDDTEQAEKDLAEQYGITYQHTFVQIDSQGNEVTKWNGGQIEELVNNIR